MYEITYEQLAVITLGLAMVAAACYALGYQAADHSNAYVVRQERNRAQLAERQKRELGAWVRKNWPDELEAFNNGHAQGYQQGIDHAMLIDDDEEFVA